MKKIAIIYHCFVHYRLPVLQALSEQLSDEYEVTFMSDVTSPHSRVAPLNFKALKNWKRLRNLWLGRWLWQRGLVGDVLKNNYEVLILLGQFNFISTWVVAILARMRGQRVLFWSHGIYGNESKLKLFLRESFYRLSDGMLLYGNYSRGLMIQHGFDPERLYVIYNSLNYEQQRSLRDSTHIDEINSEIKCLYGALSTLPLSVFIGRLTEVKKLDMLLFSLKKLMEKGIESNCLFVGDGPERMRLEGIVSELGIGRNVKFYGECHDEAIISRLLAKANVCVSPGNVGLTAMHVMAYGTPVITHDDFKWQMPEFEAIEHRVTGSFFRSGSLESLTEEMAYWLCLPPELSQKACNDCVRVVEEYFNPDRQVAIVRQACAGAGATEAGPLRVIKDRT